MLTAIAPPEFDVECDLKYATADNFTGKAVYRAALCYLHPDAARALRGAIALAAPLGLGFIVYDAFRPSEAQQKLWEHTPDPTFLADPALGTPNQGCVDENAASQADTKLLQTWNATKD